MPSSSVEDVADPDLTAGSHFCGNDLEQLRIFHRHFDLFQSSISIAANIENTNHALSALLKQVLKTLPGDAVNIRLRDPDYNCLFFRAIEGKEWQPDFTLMRQPIDDTSTGGWIVSHGRACLHPDVRKQGTPFQELSPNVQSNCGVPIVLRQRVEGALVVDSTRLKAFKTTDLDALSIMAGIAGLVLDGGQALAEQRLRAALAKFFSDNAPLSKKFNDLVKLARDSIGADDCTLFMRGADPSSPYVLRASTAPILRELLAKPEPQSYRPGEGRTGWVAKHGQALRWPARIPLAEAQRVYTRDLNCNAKYSEYHGVNQPDDQNVSMLIVPIRGSSLDPPRGMLRCTVVYRGKAWQIFSPYQQQLLEVISGELASAIDRAELRDRELSKRLAEFNERVPKQVSHMLQGPAASLLAMLPLLRKRLPATIAPAIDDVLTRIDHLAARIVGIERIVGTAITNVDPPRLEPIDVPTLARKVMELNLEGHSVIVEGSPHVWTPVLLDQVLITDVLATLADNARDFMPSLGKVRLVFSGPFAAGAGPVPTMRQTYLALAIIDNGPGIPPDQKPNLFTWGYTTRASGHGVGLYSARIRLHIMDCEILEDGEQTPHCGARFRIAFPAPNIATGLSI